MIKMLFLIPSLKKRSAKSLLEKHRMENGGFILTRLLKNPSDPRRHGQNLRNEMSTQQRDFDQVFCAKTDTPTVSNTFRGRLKRRWEMV